MALYIDVYTAEGKNLGRLYLEDKKIRIEAPTEGSIEGFKEDIRLWKKNWKHVGIVDDETLFYKIPEITSHYSRVIFSGIKGSAESV